MCVCGYVPLLPIELGAQPDDQGARPGDRHKIGAAGDLTTASPPLRAARALLALYVDGQVAGFDRLLASVAPAHRPTAVEVLVVAPSDANGQRS